MTGWGTPSRWHWRNWPVLVKLVAVLLVPTTVALVVGALRIVDQADAVPGYLRASQLAGTQQKLSELVGALQRERQLAIEFVATGRSGDRAPLEQQFRTVSDRTAAVRTTAGQVQNPELTEPRGALDELRGLRPLRQNVTSGTGSAQEVVTEYGDAIEPLIDLGGVLVRQLHDAVADEAVADEAVAAHSLLVAREQVYLQHAIILAALYADRLTPSQIDGVQEAGVRLGAAQEEFVAALDPQQRAGYPARAIGEAELSRQRLSQLVVNRGLQARAVEVAADDWNARTAAAVDDLVTVEQELRQRIDRTVLALRDAARLAAGGNAAVLLLMLGLGVLVGILIARSMLRPLGVLKRTALEVADRRLPDAMTRVREGGVPDDTIDPVAVNTREEIGQVARAFDEVHRQAVRLACEQARLRSHINDIFVNLSRRSQTLVERQLQLIDRLESSEQDPQQLDNLFQLDHLATRMRRNCDNLLVLAGTEAAKRTSRPVRLVDVLRAAVSEVEQYQRLVLQHPPGALVLGRTAADLVHLLAELLDNATQFSPPDSHVMVSAESGQDGSVTIEVMDRGVGMTEAEVAGANERLATAPVVDTSVSRRMGLFVVGRLAVRHGIGVRLRLGDDGIGVCASVTVPPGLVRPVSETDDSPAATGPPALPANSGTRTNRAAASDSVKPADALILHEYQAGPEERPPNGNGAQPVEGPGAADPPPEAEAPLPRRTGDRTVPADSPPASVSCPPSSSVALSEAEPSGTGPSETEPPGAEVTEPPGTEPPETEPPGAEAPETEPPETEPPETEPPGAEAPEADPPGTDSARDASRAGAGAVVPPGPGARARQQQSTPIFDDVATAWFRDHQTVPGRPPAASSPAQPAGVDSPAVPTGVDSPGQPARPVAAETSAEKPGTPAESWGSGDVGWRAAQALTRSASAEVSTAGLPRRKPRALLMPGAAGGAAEPVEPADSTGAPVRNAERIRNRLASYQQGTRQGRQARGSVNQDDGVSYQQQDAEEETK